MKNVFNYTKYLYKYRYYKSKLKRAMKIIDELERDKEFLMNENSVLKTNLRSKQRNKKGK